ncbi:MAG: NUDIX domain-containing protein [Clostridia bacterium]|nr:NUDIX domain-containing protein [Clostridia bacterium]
MLLERSCGAVVFTRTDGDIRYVIVTEKKGAHSCPKGHMEGSETEMETAAREIYEETGLRPAFLPGFRQQEEFEPAEKPGTRKRVVYFLAEFEPQPLAPVVENEIQEILLLPFDEALALIAHESTRDVLRAANRFLTEGNTP